MNTDWERLDAADKHVGVTDLGLTSIANAEEAQQLTCTGMMIEPTAMSQSPETVVLTLGPAQKITVDLGQGAVSARKVSDNKIQLKFRTKDFEGEYFHYSGDLFFIYKSGHLMKLTCQKRENVGWAALADQTSGTGEFV